MKEKESLTEICVYCQNTYKKKDFSICPFCGSDGGGTTPRVWKPNKYQKKEFIKKIKQIPLS